MKEKTIYVCSFCGYTAETNGEKCPQCNRPTENDIFERVFKIAEDRIEEFDLLSPRGCGVSYSKQWAQWRANKTQKRQRFQYNNQVFEAVPDEGVRLLFECYNVIIKRTVIDGNEYIFDVKEIKDHYSDDVADPDCRYEGFKKCPFYGDDSYECKCSYPTRKGQGIECDFEGGYYREIEDCPLETIEEKEVTE